MPADNSVVVTGNVTRDPILKFVPSGAAVVEFGMAVNRRFQRNNEWEEQTSFFDVKAWLDMAENIDACVRRGDRVTVTGRLEQRSWETPEGDKRSKVEIVADDVAVSLRWATVTDIVKSQRKDRSNGQESRGRGESSSAPAAPRGRGSSSGSRERGTPAPAPAGGADFDDTEQEPF